MEVAYHTRNVFRNGPSRLVGRYIIASPLDYVAEARLAPSAAAVRERIYNLFNFELLEAVNLDGRWWRLSLSIMWISGSRD